LESTSAASSSKATAPTLPSSATTKKPRCALRRCPARSTRSLGWSSATTGASTSSPSAAKIADRKDKAGIAVKLRIDRFVDDRADVLRAMRGLVPILVLFGAAEAETGMIAAPDWRRALPILLAA
jgi:hypothetical protein